MSRTVKLSSKRQIAIPRAFCDHLGIKIGEALIIEETLEGIVIHAKPTHYTAALRGLGKKTWKDPLDFIRKERAQWESSRSPRR